MHRNSYEYPLKYADAESFRRAYRSRRAAAVASRAMINHDLSIYTTSPAPPPETLFWGNIGWRQWERSMRSTLIWMAFWALSIFYVCFVFSLSVHENTVITHKLASCAFLLQFVTLWRKLPHGASGALSLSMPRVASGCAQSQQSRHLIQRLCIKARVATYFDGPHLKEGALHHRERHDVLRVVTPGLQLIPVGAVQALVNVALLSKIPPFKQLLKINFTNAIIVSILPGEHYHARLCQLQNPGLVVRACATDELVSYLACNVLLAVRYILRQQVGRHHLDDLVCCYFDTCSMRCHSP